MESGKSIPKDAQIVAEILKELGIVDYEDRVLNHMLEFTTKYVSNVIDNAQLFSNHTNNKKTIDANDVALAISHQQSKIFINPPDKELTASMAKHKNSLPLPQIKSSAVSRLPPDRYSLTACNYRIKSPTKKARTISHFSGLPTNSVKVSGTIATLNKPSPITSITTKVNSNPVVTKPSNNNNL
ncbi:hypothetical protein NPIL_602841 [Nephila pilipes]|uniref:Transcription initiation factor TFIID subunit 9 n=1 Tax=Nephila pilipes TaxID=299642 RepID=A0A8X6NZ51_NEPPI|nr:hypothetical protein NPIL_602841 [Nephila pilipes]